MIRPLLLLAGALGGLLACADAPRSGGLARPAPTAIAPAPSILEPFLMASFDGEIAPQIATSCTSGEVTALRQSTLQISRAVTQGDFSQVGPAAQQLQGLSTQCQARYCTVSEAICRRNALDSWTPDQPYELALARAERCGC